MFRACWANTGRMSHTDGSAGREQRRRRRSHVPGRGPAERRGADAADRHDSDASSGSSPAARSAAMYDNVAFQPHTGNLVVLEDGPVDVVKSRPARSRAARQRSLDLPAGRRRRRRADGRLRPLRVDSRHQRRADRVHLPRIGRRGVREHSAPDRQRREPSRFADALGGVGNRFGANDVFHTGSGIVSSLRPKLGTF